MYSQFNLARQGTIRFLLRDWDGDVSENSADRVMPGGHRDREIGPGYPRFERGVSGDTVRESAQDKPPA
jgi:hypothetical protein